MQFFFFPLVWWWNVGQISYILSYSTNMKPQLDFFQETFFLQFWVEPLQLKNYNLSLFWVEVEILILVFFSIQEKLLFILKKQRTVAKPNAVGVRKKKKVFVVEAKKKYHKLALTCVRCPTFRLYSLYVRCELSYLLSLPMKRYKPYQWL